VTGEPKFREQSSELIAQLCSRLAADKLDQQAI
jgi:hypothetical protein